MVFDAGQVVLGQSNRALGDSWGTTRCFFLAFWCVMVPLGLAARLRHAASPSPGSSSAPPPAASPPSSCSAPASAASLARSDRWPAGAARSSSFLACLPQAAAARPRPRPAAAAPGSASAPASARLLVALVPDLRRRVEGNLRLIFPEMPAAERRRIRGAFADNFGRTMIEVMTRPRLPGPRRLDRPAGPGWAALQARPRRRQGRAPGLRPFRPVGGGARRAEGARHRGPARSTGRSRTPGSSATTSSNDRGRRADARRAARRACASWSATCAPAACMAILLDQYAQGGAPIDFLGHPAADRHRHRRARGCASACR